MNRFWDTWKASTITVGKIKVTGFGVVYLTIVIIVTLAMQK